MAKPLTKKMAPFKFKWMKEAQDAMEELKYLALVAVPIRSLNYRLAQVVQPKDQQKNDLGLVSIHVDSLSMGVGWMISQKLKEAEYLVIFGSIMFNDQESQYSQLKLELFRVFCALKAECHCLHNVHFRLVVDAGFISQMI